MENKSILKPALHYKSKGLSIIPVNTDKKAIVPWKVFQERAPTDEEVRAWFEASNYNLALVTGKINKSLAVIDIDDLGLAQILLTDSEFIDQHHVVETPSGGLHIYLQETEGNSATGVLLSGVADIRAEGGYVVAPPSQDSEGNAYKVIHKAKPMKVENARAWGLELLEQRGYEPRVLARPANTEGADSIAEGGRNHGLTSFAGLMRRQGLDSDGIKAGLLELNDSICNPPIPVSEIEAIASSIGQYSLKSAEEPHKLPKPLVIRDFMAVDRPKVKWLVETLLKREGMHIWSGHPGAAKSWGAMDLGLAVASGQDFFGLGTYQCPVLFVDDDNIPDAYEERLSLLAKGRELEIGNLPIHLLVQKGSDLLNIAWAEHLIAVIRDNNVGLLVLETLRRIFSGDENSSRDVSALFRNLKRVQAETGVTVLLTHHVGKNSSSANRGSSDMDAVVDVQLVFKRKSDGSFSATEHKNRWRPANRVWSFALAEDGFDSIALALDEVAATTADEIEQESLVEQCVELLFDSLSDGQEKTNEQLRELASQGGFSDATFNRAMRTPHKSRVTLRGQEGLKSRKDGKKLVFWREDT